MTSKLHLKANPTLADYQQYVRDMVVERQFNDTVANKFMLLIEEVGEFAKSARKQAGMNYAKDSATQDQAAEAADIFVVLLCLCNMLNIDLEQAFRVKEEKNKQREWSK